MDKPITGTAGVSAKELPKGLFEAWLLLLLRSSGHGYALIEMLSRMGVAGIDHTRVYRELRSLERRGLLLSTWDVSADGPAKRVYQVTHAGEEFLAISAEGLKAYAKVMAAFMDLYATGPFSTGWNRLLRPRATAPAQQPEKTRAKKGG